ncbi:MAG: amidohydrolase family protein [Saccharolobus sp.]
MICIRGLEIITPLEVFRDDIVIEDNKIKKIGSEICNEEIVNSNAKYVVPGFIDIHTHGIGEMIFNNIQSEKDFENIRQMFYSHGVTTFIPTTISEDIDKLLYVSKILYESKSIGIHLEGPFINPNRRGAHKVISKFDSKILEISKLFNQKRITVAPEILSDSELEALANNFQVSIGHTDADLEQGKRAIGLGASSVTHIFNAMRPFHHRDPGIIGLAFTSRLYTEVIPDLIHVSDIAVELVNKVKGDRMILVTDSLYTEKGVHRLYDEEINCDNACFNKDGKLVGSSITLDEGVRRVSKIIGINEAIISATYSPAKLLDLQLGEISRGFQADLVLLDGKLTVLTTIKNGKIVYSA